ncbi:hypothetical protein LL912_19205 [Niabella sp. CC-SYL272]|uniref:hypothetical protein n=1 Tax=Niabella agricola TaxID=2891571 RepID=UPI001F3622E0|nr:hypothetical protein [Niabella agricola]MCF3110922.1 hypothetical protein [Niabella agricola]
MKNPRTPDPFHTQFWCNEATTNPYRAFYLCFSHAGKIHELRKILQHVLLFMEREQPQTDIPVYRVCCAFMAINSVITAAHYIYTHPEPEPVAGLPAYLSVLKSNLPYEQTSYTSYFISEAEHANLQEVLKTFFGYQSCDDWNSELHLVLYHALTHWSLPVVVDLFSHWFYLTKLLEAAWLLRRGRWSRLRATCWCVSSRTGTRLRHPDRIRYGG